eukprot:4185257-Pyramimonas_sp.AAC.1
MASRMAPRGLPPSPSQQCSPTALLMAAGLGNFSGWAAGNAQCDRPVKQQSGQGRSTQLLFLVRVAGYGLAASTAATTTTSWEYISNRPLP